MAKKVAKKAKVEEVVEEAEATTTPKQIFEAGISRAVEQIGGNIGHFRYKVLRAITFQAFLDVLENDGEEAFEELVDRAVGNAGELPAGWSLGNIKKATKTKAAKVVAPVEDDVEDEEAEEEEEAPKRKKPAPKRTKKTAKKAPKEEAPEELEDEEVEEVEEEEEEEAPKPIRRRPRRR